MPKVSVLMPVYNGEKYIAEAIDSVIFQTFTDWELIIGDDGSTDNTGEIVRTYSDERISYYKNEENKGHTYTKYSLLDKSSGEYIAFLDADDVSLPKRFEHQVAFLDRKKSYGLCGTWGVMINPQGKEIGNIRYVRDKESIRCGLIFSTMFLQSSLMVRRELFREYYYDPEIPLVEDYNFECLVAKMCKVANIPIPLVKYRWHDSNISNTKQEQLAALSKTIFKRELVNLAIYADEDELDIHLVLRDKSSQQMSNKEFLDEAWNWLEKLSGANQLCRTYNHYIFRATICFRWIYACKERNAYFRMFWFPVPVGIKVFVHLWRLIRLKL